ncbi:MAG: glutamine--fructose-6-phosphate transaminase (isomerizing), partial [Clostridia bacterium]|nr:glutamine--fructose-6-phosphate transaminase (isomerizing) [Clostridia bacterium]
MCGIACLIGGKTAPIDCYKALEKLEYRGYDSAGMACITKDEILVHKKQGRVENLKEFALNTKASIVISHTRWATHGAPSEVNAHPHLSQNKDIALVHNGIIENYKEITESLKKKGINLVSQTDSESALELIANESGTLLEKTKKAIKQINGSYAFAIIDKKTKSIIGVRKNSPLYVAKTKQGIMLASDIICFNSLADSYYLLEEGEFVCISKRKIKIYDSELNTIKPQFTSLENVDHNADKMGYEYFMEKEIKEIPAVIKKIVSAYQNKELLEKVSPLFENINKIVLIGCGTAYHACMYGAKVLSRAIKKDCNAYIASEYKYSDPIIDHNTLGIFVSQSGETADTLGCVKLLKEKGAETLAVTNVLHSALVKMCDNYLPVFAGAEIGVASTKAYVAQILVLFILSKYLEDKEYIMNEELTLADKALKVIDINDEIVEFVVNNSKAFYIGRGFDSITALEGALKLKEIAYISAEGYPAGELKHGTIALIEDNTPVIVLATEKSLLEKTMSACEEVCSRGAKVIV